MSESIVCQTCELNAIRKHEWGDGPWQAEPDHVPAFAHAGLLCLLHRGGCGAWCGYVGLPLGHPYHGRHYDDIAVDVHGELTYAEKCAGHVCHVPAPGDPDDVWWVGFDCAHAWDLLPGTNAEWRQLGMPSLADEHYWTLEEVRAETTRLAEQLAALTATPA